MSMLNRKHAPVNHDPGWLTLNQRNEVEPRLVAEHAMPPDPKHANRPRAYPRTCKSYALTTQDGTITNPVIVTNGNGDQKIVPGNAFKPHTIKRKRVAKEQYAAATKGERAMPIHASSLASNADVD